MFIKKLKRRVGMIMLPSIIAGLTILSVVSVTFAGVINTQLIGLEVTKISLQTQQLAENKANEISVLRYDELNTASLPRQDIPGTSYQEEVLIGTEISLGGGGNKQRTITINIYKPNESLPRFSLDKLVTLKSTPPGVPTGTIIWFGGLTPPTGFILCDGQSTSGYPELASVVGAYVPNLQGAFIRGYGSQNFVQSNGAIIGTTMTTHSSGALKEPQGDSSRRIYGEILSRAEFYGTSNAGAFNVWNVWNEVSMLQNGRNNTGHILFDSSRISPVANENRPFNVALLPCIKT